MGCSSFRSQKLRVLYIILIWRDVAVIFCVCVSLCAIEYLIFIRELKKDTIGEIDMSVSRVQTNSLAIKSAFRVLTGWMRARFGRSFRKPPPRASKEGQLSQP